MSLPVQNALREGSYSVNSTRSGVAATIIDLNVIIKKRPVAVRRLSVKVNGRCYKL